MLELKKTVQVWLSNRNVTHRFLEQLLIVEYFICFASNLIVSSVVSQLESHTWTAFLSPSIEFVHKPNFCLIGSDLPSQNLTLLNLIYKLHNRIETKAKSSNYIYKKINLNISRSSKIKQQPMELIENVWSIDTLCVVCHHIIWLLRFLKLTSIQCIE